MEVTKKSNRYSYRNEIRIPDILLRHFVLVTILLAGEFLFAQKTPRINTTPNRFRAAVVKEDITPEDAQMLLGYDPRRSTGVNDHIFHRIVAFDDGASQFFLVS